MEQNTTVLEDSNDLGAVHDDEILNKGYPGHLTAAEEAQLAALRAIISDKCLDEIKYSVESYESVLCRYLRARKFDVTEAAKMIQECMQRREKDRPDLIVAEGPDVSLDCPERAFLKFYPHYYRGFDRLGRPVLFDQVGRMNLAGVKCVTSLDGMRKYHYHTMNSNLANRYKEAASKHANPRVGLVSILDLYGLSHKSVAKDVYDYIREIAAIDQLLYPELLGRMIIINAPSIFVGIWKLVRVWLDAKTQSKIEIIKSPAVWQKRLLDYIPIEELPSDYGGKGPSLVPDTAEDIEWLTLSRSGSVERRLTVKPGDQVKQEVYITNADVEVSSWRVTGSNQMEALLPPMKVLIPKDTQRCVIRKVYTIPPDTKEICFKYRNHAALVQKHLVIINSIIQ